MDVATYMAVVVFSVLVTVFFVCTFVLQFFTFIAKLQLLVRHLIASVTVHERMAFHATCVSTQIYVGTALSLALSCALLLCCSGRRHANVRMVVSHSSHPWSKV